MAPIPLKAFHCIFHQDKTSISLSSIQKYPWQIFVLLSLIALLFVHILLDRGQPFFISEIMRIFEIGEIVIWIL